MSEKIQLFIMIVLLLVIGFYHLINNIKMYKNEEKIKEYIEKHPKGEFFKNKYGVEKAVKISKKYLLPFGTFISILLILMGLYLMIKTFLVFII